MAKTFNLDSNVIVKDLSIKGDLRVSGSTITQNQETLTIKDNLIAINGNGDRLETSGTAGLIAITGADQFILNGNYYIDGQALFDLCGSYKLIRNSSRFVVIRFDDTSIKDRFNNLGLWPTAVVSGKLEIGLDNDVEYKGPIKATSPLSIFTGTAFAVMQYVEPDTFHYYANRRVNYDYTLGPFITNNVVLKYENQIISYDDIDFVCQFMKHEDGTPLKRTDLKPQGLEIKGQAYASPIYDVVDDTLKIGLGSYEKDSDGNIIKFEFGAGQAQAIATRSDAFSKCQDPVLPYWDPQTKSFTTADNGIKVVSDGRSLVDIRYLNSEELELGNNGQRFYVEDLGNDNQAIVLENRHSKIKFYREAGEPARVTVDDKQLATLEDVKNNQTLEKAEGVGALKTNADFYGDEYNNEALGSNALALGGYSNKANNTRAVAMQNSNWSMANTAFTIGQGNKNWGNGTFAFGSKNIVGEASYEDDGTTPKSANDTHSQYSLVGGQSNQVRGQNLAVFGQNNQINTPINNEPVHGIGYRLIVGGIENKSQNTNDSIISGSRNSVGLLSNFSEEEKLNKITQQSGLLVVGDNNIVDSSYSTVLGQNNHVKHLSNDGWSFVIGSNNYTEANLTNLIGQGLYSTSVNQTIVGKYNKYSKNNALLIVGNGESESQRSNAFEVKKDGGFNSFGDSQIEGNLIVSSIVAKNSTSTSNNSVVLGDNNNLSESSLSIIQGRENILQKSPYSAIFGEKSTINGPFSDNTFTDYVNGTTNISAGVNNKINSSYSATFGANNIIKHRNGSHGYTFLAGNNNESRASRNILLGQGLLSTNWRQCIIGSYNKSNTGDVFVVGSGTSNSDRKNAFSVKWAGGFNSFGDSTVNGKLVVTSDPVNDTDVVRLKDLNAVANNLSYATLDEVTSLWN